jgi:galactosylxylosylprotein 3-beta-galactosyltransferase
VSRSIASLGQAKLFVLVISSPGNAARRSSMRDTWLAAYPDIVKARFVLGTRGLDPKLLSSLHEESKRHGDLLLLPDHEESYVRLTGKITAACIWAAEHVDAPYVLKADDDTFVHIARFLPLLEAKAAHSPFYWGYYRNNEVYRDSSSMWYEPNYFLCELYIPYALGGGYVMSMDLVALIADLARPDWLIHLGAEDAWVSTVLSIVNQTRFHDIRFDTSHGRRDCASYYTVMHKIDADEQHQLWSRLAKDPDAVCPGPDPADGVGVYAYDQVMRPSKCCSLFHYKSPEDPSIWDARLWPFKPKEYP